MRTLLEGGSFFESPRWREGRWWVSDFYRHLVLTVDADGRTEEVMTVAGQPSGLGWMPDGSLLVVSMRDRRILRRAADGTVIVHADVSSLCGGHLNDMVVDRDGGAYAGEFGFDLMAHADPEPAVLLRVDPASPAACSSADATPSSDSTAAAARCKARRSPLNAPATARGARRRSSGAAWW